MVPSHAPPPPPATHALECALSAPTCTCALWMVLGVLMRWHSNSGYCAGRQLVLLRGGGAAQKAQDFSGSDVAMDDERADDSGGEVGEFTASDAGESEELLQRGARSSMASVPNDVETLRKLEQAVRDHSASQAASGAASALSHGASGDRLTGAEALVGMMSGNRGYIDPAQAAQLYQEHEEIFGKENPLRFLSSDAHEQSRLTRKLQQEILEARVGEVAPQVVESTPLFYYTAIYVREYTCIAMN
jgi:hypothetical protein